MRCRCPCAVAGRAAAAVGSRRIPTPAPPCCTAPRRFPWDSHEVKLIFTAFSYDASEVLLVPSKASQEFDISKLSASVWELGNWTIKGYVRKSVLASKDSNVIASFTATRMVFSSMFELVLPMVRRVRARVPDGED